MTFEKSGNYVKDSNDIVTETGSYLYVVQHSNTSYDTLKFSPATGNAYQELMNIRNDTLTLIPFVVSLDGYFLGYTKQ